MIKYIVGIDFGNVKTTAWAVPISDYNDAKLHLSGASLLLHSFIDPNPYQIQLKKHVAEMSDMDKQNNANYIHKVINRLLELNKNILSIENGEPNFRLYLASPSNWSNEDKLEHLIFFNTSIKSLGLQFDAAIDEGFGALFSAYEDESDMQKCSLVIDYGSNIINYTAIQNGKIISDMSWSNQQLGASLIEKSMLLTVGPKKSEGYTNYSEMIHATQQMLTSHNLTHIDPEQVLLFELRKIKEERYACQSDTYALALSFEKITGISDFEIPTYIAKGNLTDVTREYQDAVRDDLINLRDRLSDKLRSLNNISSSDSQDITKEYRPDRIILSGGGSIMSWFIRMVKEVFDIQEVIHSIIPTLDVAKGVARYARHSYLNNNL